MNKDHPPAKITIEVPGQEPEIFESVSEFAILLPEGNVKRYCTDAFLLKNTANLSAFLIKRVLKEKAGNCDGNCDSCEANRDNQLTLN